MEFEKLVALQKSHVDSMLKDTTHLFQVNVDKDVLWNLYLDSFPAGTNKIFRERREYDCSSCRHFIRGFGNVVTIKNRKVTTIFGFEIDDPTYAPVFKALDTLIKDSVVADYLVTREAQFGLDHNVEQLEDKTVLTWNHFNYKLPPQFVNRSSKTDESIAGELRTTKQVFQRSLTELSKESVLSVLELIAQNSLYKGEENKGALETFLGLKTEYDTVPADEKDLYCWEKSAQVGPAIARLKNHAIGTLLTDLSEGKELDAAVTAYEKMVAPENYKRPKAIFTKKMLEDAKKSLEEKGLMNSLGRRYAVLDDISINNILFADRDSAKRMTGVFDKMAASVAVDPKSFNRSEEISIMDFIEKVLPTATGVEVFLENTHAPCFVSLVAPKDKSAPSMFKWSNGFSWAYAGNVTDSMKERVKSFGGKVDGVLRFSIQWNDNDDNHDDLDAHCFEPDRTEIFWRNARSYSGGNLDVDIRHPTSETKDGIAVENITFPSTSRMDNGTYKFFVHCYSKRGSRSGFSAEIEFGGQVFTFFRKEALRQDEDVMVAEVTLKDGQFSLMEKLPSTSAVRDLWGVKTQQFIPVSTIMYSPNYWDKQEGIGHRHYFFMLKGCLSPEVPNGFFNEYLKEDLMAQKRVFEALGSEMRVEPANDQLSGVGFSSTKRNDLIVRVSGQTTRTLKLKF